MKNKAFIGLRLSDKINKLLTEEAEKVDRSKSSVIRKILNKYFKI